MAVFVAREHCKNRQARLIEFLRKSIIRAQNAIRNLQLVLSNPITPDKLLANQTARYKLSAKSQSTPGRLYVAHHQQLWDEGWGIICRAVSGGGGEQTNVNTNATRQWPAYIEICDKCDDAACCSPVSMVVPLLSLGPGFRLSLPQRALVAFD